jgi:hypothetical protein
MYRLAIRASHAVHCTVYTRDVFFSHRTREDKSGSIQLAWTSLVLSPFSPLTLTLSGSFARKTPRGLHPRSGKRENCGPTSNRQASTPSSSDGGEPTVGWIKLACTSVIEDAKDR